MFFYILHFSPLGTVLGVFLGAFNVVRGIGVESYRLRAVAACELAEELTARLDESTPFVVLGLPEGGHIKCPIVPAFRVPRQLNNRVGLARY